MLKFRKRKARKPWKCASQVQYGEIPKDWVKAYTVAIANLPENPTVEEIRFVQEISTYVGFYGIMPQYPHGTILLFDTENHAKVARNLIREKTMVGDNITECFIPPEYATLRK